MGYVFQFFILLYIVCTIKTGRSQSKPQLTEVDGMKIQPVTTVRQMEETPATDNQPNFRCALILEGAINRFMVPSTMFIRNMPVWQTLSEDRNMSKEFFYMKSDKLVFEDAAMGDDIPIGQCDPQPMESNCFTESPFRLYSWDSSIEALVAGTWVYVAHHPVNLLCHSSFGKVRGNHYIKRLSPTRSLSDCAKKVMEYNKGYYGVEWKYKTDGSGTCYAYKGPSLSVDIHLPNLKVYSGNHLGRTLACVLECKKLSFSGQSGTGQPANATTFENCVDEGYRREGVSIAYSYTVATNQCHIYNTTYYKAGKGFLGCDLLPSPPVVNGVPVVSVLTVPSISTPSISPATPEEPVASEESVAPEEPVAPEEAVDSEPNYHCALIFEGAINRFMVPSKMFISGRPVWQSASDDMTNDDEFFYLRKKKMVLAERIYNKETNIYGQCNWQTMENNCFSESPFRLYHWDWSIKALVAATWVYVAQHPVNLLCRPSFGRIREYRYIQTMSSTRSLYDCAKQVMEYSGDYYGVEWDYKTETNGTCTALMGPYLLIEIHLPDVNVYSGDELGTTLACVLHCNKINVGGEPGTGQKVDANSFDDCLDEGYRRGGVSISYEPQRSSNRCSIYDSTYYKTEEDRFGCDIPPSPPVIVDVPSVPVDSHLTTTSSVTTLTFNTSTTTETLTTSKTTWLGKNGLLKQTVIYGSSAMVVFSAITGLCLYRKGRNVKKDVDEYCDWGSDDGWFLDTSFRRLSQQYVQQQPQQDIRLAPQEPPQQYMRRYSQQDIRLASQEPPQQYMQQHMREPPQQYLQQHMREPPQQYLQQHMRRSSQRDIGLAPQAPQLRCPKAPPVHRRHSSFMPSTINY